MQQITVSANWYGWKQILYMLGCRASHKGIVFYIMQIRNKTTINYVCKFVLDKSFVMLILITSDMTSN